MGYGKPGQSGLGLHMRLWARAFVLRDAAGSHLAIVNLDAAMIFHEAKAHAVKLVQRELGNTIFGEHNIMVCATHTHSGPGGGELIDSIKR